MQLESNTKNINAFFNNDDSFYVIPNYQRPYSWTGEQIDELWNDLHNAFESKEEQYFLGTIVTAKNTTSEDYERLEIVDGQQRITTLVILFCVIRDMYPHLNSDSNSVDAEEIKRAIHKGKRERLSLVPQPSHSADFSDAILEAGQSVTHKNNSVSARKLRDDDPKYKFINTAKYFQEKLEEIGEDETGKLISYIFKKVLIVRIDCESVSSAIKLFQTINARGLDLTNSDLVKSYLMGKIVNNDSDIDKKENEERFLAEWIKCEEIAGNTGVKLDNLMVMYEYFVLGENPKKSLYQELEKKVFKDTDANKDLSKFRKFIEIYDNDIHSTDDKIIYTLRYLRWEVYWKTIATTVRHEMPDDYFLRFIKIFRRYYYLNWIAGHNLNTIKQTSFSLIKKIKNHETIEDIERLLTNNLKEKSTIEKTSNNLKGNIYHEPWCKPLLFMMEYALTDDTKLTYLEITNKKIHIDHILPQKYETGKWEIDDDNRAKELLHSGGNLTLLSGKKNIAASNKPFEYKKEIYLGKGLHDNNDSKVTAFLMTQDIANNYKKWDVEEMEKRQGLFYQRMSEILEINVAE